MISGELIESAWIVRGSSVCRRATTSDRIVGGKSPLNSETLLFEDERPDESSSSFADAYSLNLMPFSQGLLERSRDHSRARPSHADLPENGQTSHRRDGQNQFWRQAKRQMEGKPFLSSSRPQPIPKRKSDEEKVCITRTEPSLNKFHCDLKVPNEVEDKVSQKFIHTYLKPGFYNIQINISNQISHHVLTERVSFLGMGSN